MVCVFSCQLPSKTVTKTEEKYSDGSIKWRKEVKVIRNKKFELENNYSRTIVTFWSYYETGKICTYYEIVYETGTDVTCHESSMLVDEYHENGKIKREYRMECDCHKEDEKTYNSEGKLLTHKTSFIKRLY